MRRDTRSALLDVAQERFAIDGFAGTSVRDLATAVGIKESSVYNHFSSKQAVLDAVLARIDERRESKLAPFDLFHLAVDASNDAYATSPDREVSLVGLTDDVAPTSAPVIGDESRMRQVVANLLTNAMRYTPAGTPLEIAVGVREDVPGYPLSVIEVRDHGPGIHGEDRERVFERFYRTDTSRSRETGGTGLGLSIVAAILEQHDGSVHIEETPGGGATFVISLPFYPAPVMTDNSVSQ